MDNPADHQRFGGESVQIGDCWVWAEINYLDSPTDYREYLPHKCSRPSNIPGTRAVVLEPCAYPRTSKARGWLSLLVVLFIIMISWFLPRILADW